MFATNNTISLTQRLLELDKPVEELTEQQRIAKPGLESVATLLREIGFTPVPDRQEYEHDELEGWVLRLYLRTDDNWGGMHCQAPGAPYKCLQGSCREPPKVASILLTICGFSVEGEKRRRKLKALRS